MFDLDQLPPSRRLQRSPDISLWDLGDDVAALELHHPKSLLSPVVVAFLTEALDPASGVVADFHAIVLTSSTPDFSLGVDLRHLLEAIQAADWTAIDTMIRSFQALTQHVKFCRRPVIVAPSGRCLGGGAEIALHAAARQPHAQVRMGLVETAIGLLPAGGGSKELTLRAIVTGGGDPAATIGHLQRHLVTILKATVTRDAEAARALSFLSPSDRITTDRACLLDDARSHAVELAAAHSSPPAPATIPAPGSTALDALNATIQSLRADPAFSDHDARVALHVAHALCAGPVAPGTPITEQHLLDLEREAFLSLCGCPQTQDRIAHTLKTGKPLRN